MIKVWHKYKNKSEKCAKDFTNEEAGKELTV